jgi:dTDP-4-dehydro-6-deoxy-alpha-D-glucopyranose 2,3-dehydratase
MLNPQLNFLISAIHRGCCMSTKDILSWMKKKNNEICYHLQQIPLKNLKDWTDKNGHPVLTVIDQLRFQLSSHL